MYQLHSSSIRTEFSECDYQNQKLYRAPSFTASHRPSNKDLYTHKLQAIARDHSKTIQTNKPIIQQLECQRRFFRRICQKQKEKIQQVDLSLLREEYEQQVNSLRQKRNKMHEIITRFHEDAEEKRTIYEQISKCLQENQRFLEASLLQVESENTKCSQILQKKRDIVKLQEQRLTINAETIVEKERIQEKYSLIKGQIERKQAKIQLN